MSSSSSSSTPSPSSGSTGSSAGGSTGGTSLTPYLLAGASLIGYYVLKNVFSPKVPLDQAKIDLTQKLAVSSSVFVASKSYCPYCTSAKKLLQQKGVKNIKVIELDDMADGSSVQDALYEITGQRTVPNIFIGGKHVGGNSELQVLERQGKLTEMLELADAL